MTKGKRQRRSGASNNRPVPGPTARQPSSPWLHRIPLLGWVLIFVLPLILSEFMFSVVGRTANMILFPIAWIAFWATILYRYWWPVLKRWLRLRE